MKKVCILLIILLLFSGCQKNNYENGEVNVLNWSSYIPQDVIADFEKEYNVKVNYGTYSSNEELLAKISNSKEGIYDLVFPSDYMVELMIHKNLLEKLDKSKIKNYNNINSIFLNQEFDINNEYSIPFLAATTVIAYNSKNISEDITSYNDLLNSKYKNDIVLLEDQRIIIGMALNSFNYDMSETNKIKLDNAKDWLLKLRNNVKAYDSDSPKTFLITGETNIGVMWNAEAKLSQLENSDIKIVYPKEGHAISLDNYVIIKNSKNSDNAYLFIDYLLRSDISKRLTDEYPYINTTIGAQNLSESELSSVFNNGNYVKNIGSDISLYDKIWAEIK